MSKKKEEYSFLNATVRHFTFLGYCCQFLFSSCIFIDKELYSILTSIRCLKYVVYIYFSLAKKLV